jgi:hypothetical protein
LLTNVPEEPQKQRRRTMKRQLTRTKATLLLVLALACLIGMQLASTQGNAFLVGEFYAQNDTAKKVMACTAIISGVGVEVAAALLLANPFLGIALGAAYAA